MKTYALFMCKEDSQTTDGQKAGFNLGLTSYPMLLEYTDDVLRTN